MRTPRPLPVVGDRIRKDYGPNNINTWICDGEVRGIVDEHLVIRAPRRDPDPDTFHYMLLTPEDWTYIPWRHNGVLLDGFECASCGIMMAVSRPLGTTPEGVVGHRRWRDPQGRVIGGITGHVAVGDRHYCLSIDETSVVLDLAQACSPAALVGAPSLTAPREDWMRFFIQRDLVRNGDAPDVP